ncbi:MAG: hypothetical protein IJ124_12130 [Clostridia bacterium]|nr:hypothetical protein [Clostridia bacterium]
MIEESRYLTFSGVRVHFCVVRPDTPVHDRMLLLSSPLINTFHWRKLLPELAELGCLAVLADLPGFGKSDCAAPQGADVYANLIWGVLDDVDRAFGAPMSMWHLAGHGGACAAILRMGVQYPDSVKSQIHIAPLFSLAMGRGDAPERWYDENIRDPRRFSRAMEQLSGFPMDDYIVDRMRAPLLRPGARGAFGRMARRLASPPREGMGFCPTMALLGGRDPLLDEVRLRQVRSLLPDAEVHRLASSGHFPMETHSKALRDYLRGWLRYNA